MATALQKQIAYLLPGMGVILLGSMVLFGWQVNLPLLMQIMTDWKPMLPITALSFVLSGIAIILQYKTYPSQNAAIAQRLVVGLILLIVSAWFVELMVGHDFGLNHLVVFGWNENIGHRSALTVVGFLLFSIGMLATQGIAGHKYPLLARIMAGALLLLGMVVITGYWLGIEHAFEPIYIQTGLVWMSMPSAIGLLMLGIGVWRLSSRIVQDALVTATLPSATRINHTTMVVILVTSSATALVALSFMNKAIIDLAASDMAQLQSARLAYLDNNLDNRTQRALVAGLQPELKTAALNLLRNSTNKPALIRAQSAATDFLSHGFTGVGLVDGEQILTLAGRLLPATARYAPLGKESDVALTWDNGFILRVRVPVKSPGYPGGTLVFEQTLANLNKVFREVNNWGATGALLLCSRLDPVQLLCFPERGQSSMYVIPDSLNGKPIPVYYALAGQSGVATQIDYRGHHVLATYGPVGNKELGLVLKMDFFEIYAPVKQALLFSIPLIALLVITGLWVIRRQVNPLVFDLAEANAKEKLLLQDLAYSNRLRSAIVESAAYSIISTDAKGTILTFNKAAERMLWYRASDLVGKATPAVFHDAEEIRERAVSLGRELNCEVEPGFEVFVAKANRGLHEEREWTYVRKDGSRFPVLLSVTALHDSSNQINGFLGIAYDISERKRNEEYIRHIALHDVLTGLPNRALLDDRVKVTINQQHRNNGSFVLAMMDIDHFKHINDTMGHHVGDLLLKQFVERVKSCLRPSDTLARMGGDEFVLLLPDSDEVRAAIVMERILQALTMPINVEVQQVHISSSIGFSIYPRDGNDVQELLRRADVAMYWTKGNGRNGYKMFSPELDSSGVSRLNLERDLHTAIENDGFVLFYQPKLDLKNNAISGVEALIRLPKENGQYVSPADFIPLAEEIGLIVPMGHWVLKTACHDMVRLQKLLDTTMKVAVNVSPRQFMNGDLVGTVIDVLAQTGLQAEQLELEITEGVLIDERMSVAAALLDLRKLGVSIAIDDFGTGYSSLSYLKRFPISTLKIDQSFVRDMLGDTADAALVSAIIAMGHSLNMPVVAEGIETAEQLAYLASNKCDMGQGFYIGRPMPFDKLVEWFASDYSRKLAQHQE